MALSVSAVLFRCRDSVARSELGAGREGVEEEGRRGMTQRRRELWLQLVCCALARALPSDLERDLGRGNGGESGSKLIFVLRNCYYRTVLNTDCKRPKVESNQVQHIRMMRSIRELYEHQT